MKAAARKTEVNSLKGEITVEVWGDFACFTPPYSKVERLTYPAPTPSAARGILSSIYSKPKEFYWQITRIEVLKPIRYLSFMRNEVKSKVTLKDNASESVINSDDSDVRTQRQTQVLCDVRYRITARICPQVGFESKIECLYGQAMRRIRTGKMFCAPCLGMREFVCYFEESDGSREPIDVSMDMGLVLYDVFNLHEWEVTRKPKYSLSLYHAVMKHGVIEVPDYDSDEVIKGGERIC